LPIKSCTNEGIDQVVFFKGERMGDATTVDFVANDRPGKADGAKAEDAGVQR
jgi:hypothetical protein